MKSDFVFFVEQVAKLKEVTVDPQQMFN